MGIFGAAGELAEKVPFKRLTRDEVKSALADALQLTPATVDAALQDLPNDVADAARFIAPASMNFQQAPGRSSIPCGSPSDRLLSEARSDAVFSRFFSQWMGLASLPDLKRKPARDGTILSSALRNSMREEAVAFVHRVLHGGNASLTELVTQREMVVDAFLERHYGLTPPTSAGFLPQMPATQQSAGLLTLGAFLVAAATNDAPSPTRYGVRVRDDFLCHRLPPLPPGVDATLPPLQESDTVRVRADAHTKENRCAGCHRYLDPRWRWPTRTGQGRAFRWPSGQSSQQMPHTRLLATICRGMGVDPGPFTTEMPWPRC